MMPGGKSNKIATRKDRHFLMLAFFDASRVSFCVKRALVKHRMNTLKSALERCFSPE